MSDHRGRRMVDEVVGAVMVMMSKIPMMAVVRSTSLFGSQCQRSQAWICFWICGQNPNTMIEVQITPMITHHAITARK